MLWNNMKISLLQWHDIPEVRQKPIKEVVENSERKADKRHLDLHSDDDGYTQYPEGKRMNCAIREN